MSPAEKEAVARAAEIQGVDISVLMRSAVRKEVVRILAEIGEENPFIPRKPKKVK